MVCHFLRLFMHVERRKPLFCKRWWWRLKTCVLLYCSSGVVDYTTFLLQVHVPISPRENGHDYNDNAQDFDIDDGGDDEDDNDDIRILFRFKNFHKLSRAKWNGTREGCCVNFGSGLSLTYFYFLGKTISSSHHPYLTYSFKYEIIMRNINETAKNHNINKIKIPIITTFVCTNNQLSFPLLPCPVTFNHTIK